MLPTIVHLLEAIRRALKKTGRGASLVADAFNEAMRNWRASKRKYPFPE